MLSPLKLHERMRCKSTVLARNTVRVRVQGYSMHRMWGYRSRRASQSGCVICLPAMSLAFFSAAAASGEEAGEGVYIRSPWVANQVYVQQ